MKLKNKIVIITGSSRGIGKATAILFAKEGARVVVNCKDRAEDAKKVVSIIGKSKAFFIQADVSKEDDVKRLVSEAMKKFGRIDILVNNAGVIFREGNWRTDLNVWQKTMDMNLNSAWLMTKEVAPIMLKNKSGSIVNISSIYGSIGAASALPYSVAKSGLITITKALAKEFAPNIRVNAVVPGNVLTDMTSEAGKKVIEHFEKQTPLLRSANPEEIAKSILFLASDDASFITGEMLTVDGGYCLK